MQAKINKILEHSKNDISPALKQRTAELIFRIRERHSDPFGLFVILGWQERWQKFAVTPDSSQDIFRGRNIHQPYELGQPVNRQRHIGATLNFDGAILIDREGNILHSGVMIEGLRPREIAAKLNPGEFSDLSRQFGFKEKVHTRHLTAITASFQFKGTTVFTVSEESGSIHVFEDGKIVYASPRAESSRN
jgi:DNA integrity scanning protein DisA with diadenylate cyclase activity